MLQIPQPGCEGAERRAGWHNLTEVFSAALRESFVSEGPLDFVSLHQTLGAWEDFARAWDGKGLLGHPSTLDEWERMRAMAWCADYVRKTIPPAGGASPTVLTALPATAPREALSRAEWSLACIRLFRGEAPARRVAVPIALADEMVQLKGGIATLVLDVFFPGTGRLTLHPEESFRVLPDADFTESLNTAWRLALEIAKSDDGQSDFPDVVWRVVRESPSMSGLDEKAFLESSGLRLKGEITGRSASGAAARAFRHLLKGTTPDPDVFVLAQVRKDGTPTSQLQGVGGIRAKVEAIADAGQHAVVIVTESDKAEADLAVSKKKANLRIKIEVDIPHAITKLLDDAAQSSDDDRFADAIPILEKALHAATKAKHRAAEAKIHIRLGHALFEGKEDFAGAEEHFREALVLAGEPASLMRHSALHGIADMLLWAGRLDEASAAIQTSLEVAKTLGEQDAIGRSLISLGILEAELGHAESVKSHLEHAIRIFQQLSLTLKGDERKETLHALAVCYQNKAKLERDDGRLEDTLALYDKVEELHRDSGDKLNSGKIHLLSGKLHCANGNAEEGFRCFTRAIAIFLELKNSLWMARVSETVARLYAQHERWEEALKAALAAVDGFKEAGRRDEQVAALLFAARLASKWQKWDLRESVWRQIHAISTTAPKDQEAEIMAGVSAQMTRVHKEIAEKVRTDPEIRSLLDEAKALAENEQFHKDLAECFLAEMELVTRNEDKEARRQLIENAVTALKKALEETRVPKRRGHLMGEISSLYRELGNRAEAASWLRRAGEIFEKAGDVFGLANFHGSMAELHRDGGSVDDEIVSYRKVLELIEGRSFHELAAGTRINLAGALRFRRDFREALELLTEAEVICERHRMKDFISAIARNRTDIETELNAGQAASQTLPQLLDSLNQLVTYKPEHAVGYLAFWYSAWKTELMALFRSGPGISLMVVTDDVERFLAFAATFDNLADHFLMATTKEPTVAAEKRVLALPPTWLFPASFTFVGIRRVKRDAGETAQGAEQGADEGPPNIHFSGPAAMLPPYMFVSVPSEVEGEGHVSTPATPHLPVEAVELMARRPISELIQRRAVWFPSPRFDSRDAFLTDLRVAHERGLFPVYFDRLPTSDGVTEIGGVTVHIPSSALTPAGPRLADRWKRALLKIPRMQKEAAQAYLVELPDVFSTCNETEMPLSLEVHLFEFTEVGRRVIRPVLLAR